MSRARPTDDPAILVPHADALVAAGRHTDALPLLRRAATTDPQNPRVHLLLAVCHHCLADDGRALAAADTAVALAPDHEWGHRLRTLALLGLHRVEEALQAAHRAIETDAAVPGGWVALSRVELVRRRYREAALAAERAKTIAPKDPASHHAIGEVAMAAREWAAAETAYRRVLDLDPDDDAAHTNLSLAVERRRRHVEARQNTAGPRGPRFLWRRAG